MQAQKVAGRQGPGWSGEMDPKTRTAAAAAANALFIFCFHNPTAKIAAPKLNPTRICS
jgi:hypothetical protein